MNRFPGSFTLSDGNPPKPEHIAYLKSFCATPRWVRNEATARIVPDPIREDVGLPIGEKGCLVIGLGHFDGTVVSKRAPKCVPGLNPPFDVESTSEGVVLTPNIGHYSSHKGTYIADWLTFIKENILDHWGYNMVGCIAWDEIETTGIIFADNGELIVDVIEYAVDEDEPSEGDESE